MSILHKRLQISEMRNTMMLYRRLIENLSDRIAVKDIALVYVICNEAYAHDLNIAPDEILGKSDHDFFPNEQAEKIVAEERAILLSGEKKKTEEKYTVSGKELTVCATKTPLRNDNGSIIGLQIVLQDIAHHVRQREYLVSMNKNLEGLLVQEKENADALKSALETITAQRNQLEIEIKDVQKRMTRQMAFRDAKIEKLKKDLQQKTRERKDAVKLLRKSFSQIERVLHSVHLPGSGVEKE